ncbi:MAG: hypothetical protein OXE46_15005 [Chloroflexi bacterium]|nr:hypothetical protein [Chloroflexota bacterium]
MTIPNLPHGYEESRLPLESGADGKLPIPHADEALELLTPVAQRCVCLLAAATSDISDQAAFALYIQSVDAARQVAERRVRVGPVNVDALAATIDLPAINETLPLLAKAYEDCLSLWNSPRHLMYTMILLFQLGSRQYADIGSGGMTPVQPLFDS